MKKSLLIALIFTLILTVCACKKDPSDTEWYEDTGAQSTTEDTSTSEPSPTDHLMGEWKNEQGEREIIDGSTIGGAQYTIDSVNTNEYGDVTVRVCINNSHVTYTVYRYKVGYAEYSYMEALIEAKGITISYTK